MTLSELATVAPPFDVQLNTNELHNQKVIQYKAVVSQVSELVHSGDFVKLATPVNEFTYGQLLTTLKLVTGRTVCVVRGFEAMALPDSSPLMNEFDCPLFLLSRTVLSVDSTNIQSAVSFVHQCDESCRFVERNVQINQEREVTERPALVYEHNWNNLLYCYNVYCIV